MQSVTLSPRYSEAYPRVSIGEALRGHRAGMPDVLWRNRLKHAVGFATIDWPQPDVMVMFFHIQNLEYVDEAVGAVELTIIYKGSTLENLRPYAECEGCCRHIDVVIYAESEWRCKTCLRLSNRSTLIDPVVRITEELDEIERVIGSGRPRGMRMARFATLEQRYIDLLNQLGGNRRRSASQDYRHRIDAEWLPRSMLNISHLRKGE